MNRKMSSSRSTSRPVFKFIMKNWFFVVFFSCLIFVGGISFYKLFLLKEQFVFAKVKVSQGLWWANTNRSPVWFLKALKPGLVARSLAGAPNAEVQKVRYYPYYQSGQYDIYLVLKLKVKGDLSQGNLNFNRSALAVGAPIEFSFPKVELTGTIIDLSLKPFEEKLVKKNLVLMKTGAYQWEYDAIAIGDQYFNGEQVTLKILEKSLTDNPLYAVEPFGSFYERSVTGFYPEPRKIITLKVWALVEPENGRVLYGEEQELRLGKLINLSTNSFFLQDFMLAGIE